MGKLAMNVNNVLTNKGGAGKSLICALLGCYFQERDQRTLNIDLDPNQPTFSRYTGLQVQRFDLTRNGKVDGGLFDDALEPIYGPDAAQGTAQRSYDQVVIDSGAGGYLPFVSYMRRQGVMDTFEDLGIRHTLHVVLAGGQALDDCLLSLDQLATHFGAQSRIVVWLNDYFDALPWPGIEGFYDSGAYRKHGALIDGIVQMPDLDPETEGRTFAQFVAANQTFDEALASGHFRFSACRRLIQIRRTYFEQLDAIFGDLGQALNAAAES